MKYYASTLKKNPDHLVRPKQITNAIEKMEAGKNFSFHGKVEFRLYGTCCQVSGKTAETLIFNKLRNLAINYMNRYAVTSRSFSRPRTQEGYDDERGRFISISFLTHQKQNKVFWVQG
jgi:hypothetical protein